MGTEPTDDRSHHARAVLHDPPRTRRYADVPVATLTIGGTALLMRETIGMGHSIGSILFRVWCFVRHPIFAIFFWRELKEPPDRIDELNLRDG